MLSFSASKVLLSKLNDSNAGIGGTIGSLRAGTRPPRLSESDGGQVNPAPTKRVGSPVVGAGFTPARIGCLSLSLTLGFN